MATVADRVLDNGLTVLDTEASRVDITSQEATTYAEATSTYTLGNTTSISISAPADRTGGGRKVTLCSCFRSKCHRDRNSNALRNYRCK